MATRAAIIASARSMIGTPFQHQGRTPGVALDCVGLLVCVAQDLGLPYWDGTDYGRPPHPRRFRDLMREHMVELPGAGEPGDVLCFHFVATSHAAIVTQVEPMRIVHAYAPFGRVHEHDIGQFFLRRARLWYAFKGLR